MDKAGQGYLLNGVVRKCHLTELVFCVEYSKFKGEGLSHQLFCYGGEQKGSHFPLTYTYGESTTMNADCEGGGSAGKSVDC